MNRITNIGEEGCVKVITNDLTEEQHNIAVEMIKNDCGRFGNYFFEEVDEEDFEIFFDDAKEEDDKDLIELFNTAEEYNSDVYSLCSGIGDFTQPLGFVAVIW